MQQNAELRIRKFFARQRTRWIRVTLEASIIKQFLKSVEKIYLRIDLQMRLKNS